MNTGELSNAEIVLQQRQAENAFDAIYSLLESLNDYLGFAQDGDEDSAKWIDHAKDCAESITALMQRMEGE